MEKASHKVFNSALLISIALSLASAILIPALAVDKIEPLALDKHPYSPLPFMAAEINPAHAGVPSNAVSKKLIDQISKVKNEAPFRHGMHYMVP